MRRWHSISGPGIDVVTVTPDQLPLNEVVRMTVGSIVQLNRSASDPVDVLVNNSVVARGEVVVIDGNYGVRVTQVASREERLEQML